MRRYILAGCVALRLAPAADEAPGWLREAEAAATGSQPRGAPAAVLLNEERVSPVVLVKR